MRKFMLASAVLLTTAIGASSFAMADKGAERSPAQMQERHASMCSDRSAREIGHLAYLEAKLKPTAAQTAAWTKYRDTVTAQAKANEQDCLARPARKKGDARPSIVERNAMMQKALETRLASLKATQPALEGLYAVLTDAQKQVINKEGREGKHRSGHWGDRDHHRGTDHKPGMSGKQEATPAPEAPAQQ